MTLTENTRVFLKELLLSSTTPYLVEQLETQAETLTNLTGDDLSLLQAEVKTLLA